nr:DUF3515 family protein [Nocardioides perillae]
MTLVGCGGPVELGAPPELPRADAAACADLLAALPDTLGDLERRDVEPAAARGAAWGDPAVVLTCGVGVPEGFDAFSPCEEADGVGWYAAPVAAYEDPTADVVLTTVTAEPRLRLEVPGSQRPPAGYLSRLAPLVREHLRATGPCV